MTKKRKDKQSKSGDEDAESGYGTPIQRAENDRGEPAGTYEPGGTREPAGTYEPGGTREPAGTYEPAGTVDDAPKPETDRDSTDFGEKLYDSLDETEREALAHIKLDPELWSSWQATISSDIIQSEIEANGTDVIETALERYHKNIIEVGHEPITFLTGEQANERYLEVHPEDEPPHEPSCIALKSKPDSADELCKAASGSPLGEFWAREDVIRSFEDREEAMNKLALKEAWGEYDSVATLELEGDEKTALISSTVGEIVDDSEELSDEQKIKREGGVEQFWLTDHLAGEKFEMVDETTLEEFLRSNQ